MIKKIWLSIYCRFLEYIIERDWFSDFYYRKEVKRKIGARADNIVDLMLKIYLIDQPKDIEDWIKWVNRNFNYMRSDLTMLGNRAPPKELLYSWFIDDSPYHFRNGFIEMHIGWWQVDEPELVLRGTDRESVINEILSIAEIACGIVIDGWDDGIIDIRNYLPKEIYQC